MTKHFKLSKGGMILTDSKKAVKWFKKARFSGRGECSYHDDTFDMIGWNYYMPVETSVRGMLLIRQFYNEDGSKKQNPDIRHKYPDLSKFKIYTEGR